MAKSVSNDWGSIELPELVKLREEIDGVIAEKADAERVALREKLAALDALTPKARVRAEPVKGTRATPAPKYRSKKDPNLTYSGRGAIAGWLRKEMEETGEPIEAFLIKQ